MKIINSCAFESCKNLTGSLIIPEGVTEVKTAAFGDCAFNGSLSLPSTLKNLVMDSSLLGIMELSLTVNLSVNLFCLNHWNLSVREVLKDVPDYMEICIYPTS